MKSLLSFILLLSLTLHVSAEKVKVGIISPLSGNSAQLGEGFRDAMILANEKLSDKPVQLELIFEDDQLDPKQTANALRKLVEKDKCDALVSYFRSPGMIVMPVANQRHIPHFATTIDKTVIQGDYNFSMWNDVNECVPLFVQELQKRNIKNLAIVTCNIHAAVYINSFLQPALTKAGIKYTNHDFIPGERDFRTILNKIKKENPDSIYFFAFSPEIELFCKQKEEMNYKTPLTTINGFDWAKSLKPFEGCWYVSYSYTDRFYNDFFAKYKRDPYASSGNGYDIINIISEVANDLAKSNQPITRESLQKGIATKKDFSGVLGTMSADQDGFFKTESTVKEVKNGRAVTIK